MIRIASLTALLSFVLVCAEFAYAQQQWIDYRPAGAGYRVEFPAKPVEDVRDVTTNVGTIKMRTSSVDIGGKVFMTIDSLYPSNVSMGDPQVNLDGARNSGVRNVEGTLRAEERLSVANAPARRMVIDMPRTNQSADALIVLDGRRMYQAVYVGPRGTEEAPEVKRFLSSFALVR